MSDANEFDKEKFLDSLYGIPYWVKTGDDLLIFLRHIQYRLLQGQAVELWYRRNFKLTDDQIHEIYKIMGYYDDAYNNSGSGEWEPFKDIFKQ